MMQFFQTLLDWYLANLNYFTITLLMAIESTFVPLPSEMVIPPAAYIAAGTTGQLNIFLVVFFGTLGAVIGSLFNYLLARYLGRTLLYKLADSKLGHLFLLNGEAVQKTENYFIKNGKSSTFIGRLIPGVRHLISIPAGLAKMDIKDFILYTTLGALVWNIILAVIGFYFYSLKDKYFHELTILLYILGGLFVLYLVYKGIKVSKSKKQ